MNKIDRLITSFRNRELNTSMIVIKTKAKFYSELLFPVTIWGERIGLRSTRSGLTNGKIEQAYNLSRDEEMLRWSGGAPSQLALEQFREQTRRERWRFNPNQSLFYIITKKNEIIGRVGLYTIDWTNREGEFGISIGKNHWDKRYGREATDLFIQFIFNKTPINRIYLGTFQDNLRAQRSFAASGFYLVGTMSHFLPSESRYVDGVKMEITARDFLLNQRSSEKKQKSIGNNGRLY